MNPEIVMLKDLEIGDIFVHARKGSSTTRFTVRSKKSFYTSSGRAYQCIETGTGKVVGKTRSLSVIKVGESVHKARFLKQYGNQK